MAEERQRDSQPITATLSEPSRRGALYHSRGRLSGLGRVGPPGSACVRRDCTRLAACFAHAVSYLHPAGAVGRFHYFEHCIGEISDCPDATLAWRGWII